MLTCLSLTQYINLMLPKSNCDASLALMLEPFGLHGLCDKGIEISVGLILDDLQDRLKEIKTIDPFDVASSLWFFDCEAAGFFLDDGPYHIYCLLKEQMLSFHI